MPLTGPCGEPVDLWRTMQSHGMAELPPVFVDHESRTMHVVTRLGWTGPYLFSVAPESDSRTIVTAQGVPQDFPLEAAVNAAKHLLRMDEDLSRFYALVAADANLSWASRGAGRMARSATIFEDVIKTLLTTNCAWSATIRMVTTLVDLLGEQAINVDSNLPISRAFPTADAMAAQPESFFRSEVKAGYRAPHLVSIAERVAAGELNLEILGTTSADDLPDEELAEILLSLPGVGPYAMSHIMMMLGRYRPLILDSWTRPTYNRMARRKKPATDAQIERQFRRYGEFAGLAFWLFLTRDWITDQEA